MQSTFIHQQEIQQLRRQFSDQLNNPYFDTKVTEVLDRQKQQQADQLFACTLPFEAVDPLAFLELLPKEMDFTFYWEHPEQSLAMAAGEALIQVDGSSGGRFSSTTNAIDDWKQRTVEYSAISHSLSSTMFVGGFSFFDDGGYSEHWKSFGQGLFYVPEWNIVRDGKCSLLSLRCLVDQQSDYSSIKEALRQQFHNIIDCYSRYGEISRPFDKRDVHLSYPRYDAESTFDQWSSDISAARGAINHHQYDKIVLARELNVHASSPVYSTRVANYLRDQYPSCYTFILKNPEGRQFIGSTPERLISFNRHHLLTEGLAGSISRGNTASEDAMLEKRLLQSNKNLSEHQFVLDSIMENLQPYADQIDKPDQPAIKKLSNVQHLYTPITARLSNGNNPIQLIDKLHPTPAVGGYPRKKAMQHIQKLENFDRGWYAGPVGWINSEGHGTFAVAIRSGLISGAEIRLFAGCGIVRDSNPEEEWMETKLKLIPMLSALKHG